MRYNDRHASFFILARLVSHLSGHPLRDNPTPLMPAAASWVREGYIGLGPRQEHSVSAINNTIYVVGGVIHDDTHSLVTTARVESFDTERHQWSVPAPLPRPINHVNLAAVHGHLYSFGGLAGTSPEDPAWLAVPECHKYDPHTDVWSAIASMPGTGRGSSAMGVHGSIVYVAGGMSSLIATANGTQDALAEVSSYDTATDTWRQDCPPLPAPRQHAGAAVVNGTLYVIGGRIEVEQHYDTVFSLALDQPGAAWQERAPMLTSRGGLACAALEDRYVVCAGGEGNPDSPLGVFEETEMYDAELDRWMTLSPMDVPRHGTAAVTIGDRVYVPGGGIAAGGGGGTGGVFDYLAFGSL